MVFYHRKFKISLVIITVLWILLPMQAEATNNAIDADALEKGNGIAVDEVFDTYHMQDMEEELDTLFPDMDISLKEIFTSIFMGEIENTFDYFIDNIWKLFAGELSEFKSVFVLVLSLGIISALFTNFMDIFENHQIADISFYFAYMLLMTILLRIFEAVSNVASEALENLLVFMKLLIPSYFTAVSVAAGTTTAYVFYRLMLILIYGIEYVLSEAMLPFIYTYTFLSIVNGLWIEERLTTILELIQKGVAYALKTILTVISGISVLQAMITPVIDSVKIATLQKAVSVIPGIGNFANGVSELVIGSAVLIKNSIGVLMIIVLLILCMVPLVKLVTVSGLLKGSAAFVGVICDKRMTNCIDRIGDATWMLLRMTMTAMILFIITIAIVVCSTNRGVV
ncbi:MAG: stage III sporulation protein AE [Lachnospiraceae bacterium]|nr:stage III sporulation protein AE [Lachnospiraceae bacterium]